MAVITTKGTTLNYEPSAPKIAAAVDLLSAQVAADLTSAIGGANTCRAVATALAAYAGTGTGVLTASATGLIGAQDGVTLAAGDLLLLPSTVVTNVLAADTGPWVVTNPGGASAKYVLTRPTWYAHGSAIAPGTFLEVGGEGTKWQDSVWKPKAPSGTVVDTGDGLFYPANDYGTTAAMVAGVSPALSTLYVLNTNIVHICEPFAPAGTQGILRASTLTPGQPGTSSVVITSSSATETSTVKFMVTNF